LAKARALMIRVMTFMDFSQFVVEVAPFIAYCVPFL